MIFNHSSESMKEIPDNSIDLVIADPPYNIGTEYTDSADICKQKNHDKMMNSIFEEIYRVLKAKGRFVLLAADTLFSEGIYYMFSARLRTMCEKNGFHLINRHIGFAHSRNFRELVDRDHHWEDDFHTKENSHSNVLQILIFTKTKSKPEFDKSGIFYYNYREEDDHPCPYPNEIIKDLLGMYFRPGFSVLDPFMGIGRLGKEVIKRGNFYGYEVRKVYFEKAQKRLEKSQ